ncbi:MAG: hypothetical protein ACLRSW_15255 [Christensenellaceae bacterium]
MQRQADKNSLDDGEQHSRRDFGYSGGEIPQAMIERKSTASCRNSVSTDVSGLKLQDYLDFIKTTKEEFRKITSRRKNVLNQLVISQIIKDER